MDTQAINRLKKIYSSKKKDIIARLKEFGDLWSQKNDEAIFTELAFCLLTPQSKAKSCWNAIRLLEEKDILLKGKAASIKTVLKKGVRFHNKKAEYLVNARSLFLKGDRLSIKQTLSGFPDVYACREWLVKNIKGLGFKEASHFLRNIGSGEAVAILDRHILKNLKLLGIIDGIPASLSSTRYKQIENKMAEFAKKIDIPLSHLDLLLWYKETGEIFK